MPQNFMPNPSKTYDSKYGPYRIIKILDTDDSYGDSKAIVEFLETGYRKLVNINSALRGKVKDDIAHSQISNKYRRHS